MAVEVADWNDLDNVRNDLTGDYVLVNDLDESTAAYTDLASETANDGDGWEPIGDLSDEFEGTFDGQGYEISDLVIDGGSNSGLFAQADDSVIQNLSVLGADVSGGNRSGIIIGRNAGGTIENVFTTGTVEGSNNTAGVAGINSGTVQNCYTTANVTGSSETGGLVGDSSGDIIASYATGDVVGINSVGGLVGSNRGFVENSYASGDVDGDEDVGGFVGVESSNNSDQGIEKCYSSNDSVTGNDNLGAFCGQLGSSSAIIGEDNEGYIFDSYVDIELSNQSEAIGDIFEEGASDVEEKQTAEMQGSEAETNMDGFDFANVWDAVLESDEDTTADGYPILLALNRENQLEAQGIFQELEPPEPPENLTAELL